MIFFLYPLEKGRGAKKTFGSSPSLETNDLILQVEDLSVELENQSIIEHLSFTVKRGEVVTVLGPNGAGKTVLLKCLLRLLPYTGTIAWKKRDKNRICAPKASFHKRRALKRRRFF